ncbi:hypothetical protein TNIN_404361 [Trichonephila inaurata madagascariensis]|uniref:Uncharacterized protein n=1 Tax=Trichonephila inaurata madagascariensis TaxID=2747483 RepID=A0A8X6YYZ0_9ARAC|nr:hypothetical protein TNIN_404361 [Trichonephila inaurata madagascariensis]
MWTCVESELPDGPLPFNLKIRGPFPVGLMLLPICTDSSKSGKTSKVMKVGTETIGIEIPHSDSRKWSDSSGVDLVIRL